MIHYETKLPVRYYECDPMGIVHHSNYLRYFECARDEMIASWGYGIQQCQRDGITFPVASTELRFHRPALMGDILTVVAEIVKVPLAKIVVNQKVINQKGDICCEGSITLGFLSAATGRPTRCPEHFASLMKAAGAEE